MEPESKPQDGAQTTETERRSPSAWPYGVVALAAVVGLGLMVDSSLRNSATYDEVAYLRIATRWWRTGDQDQITRMGSPLTFWKLQQAPTLWAIDRAGFGGLLDRAETHQSVLLPLLRIGSLWVWLVALLATAAWARIRHGPRAMVLAACLFAFGPNLLAHGPLLTMEMPLVACSAAVFGLYASYLKTGSRRTFVASALVCGLAFSCKFSAIAFPPILALCGWLESLRRGDRLVAATLRGGFLMSIFLALMLAANLVITGFSTTTPSEHRGVHPALSGRPGGDFLGKIAETPMPSDWVGLAIQLRHQRSGGPSYLMGETRSKGWWYYYLVALAVKVPLAFWWLFAVRSTMRRGSVDDRLILTSIAAFLTLAAIGSSRNYGVRYVLPLAPLAIVWISALAEGDRRHRAAAIAGIVALFAAVATIHPHELSYFQEFVGGPERGRRILADSNLDWGQGLKSLAELQREHPEYRDLTLYYFGDTRPAYYGVSGRHHVINADRDHPDLPPNLEASTRFLAVSTSLLSGPWSPPGYFRGLDGIKPVATLRDGTISIYDATKMGGD